MGYTFGEGDDIVERLRADTGGGGEAKLHAVGLILLLINRVDLNRELVGRHDREWTRLLRMVKVLLKSVFDERCVERRQLRWGSILSLSSDFGQLRGIQYFPSIFGILLAQRSRRRLD